MAEKLKILILDDEVIVGKRLAPTLQKHGCDVEVFSNPVDVIKRVNEKDFDIVVTDLRMKEMDGLEVLRQVKAKNERTKIIIITGYAMMEIARKAMDLGAFDFIAKPFKPNDLKLILNKAAAALGIDIDLTSAVSPEE
ncbi:MAG: response regulator [Nitrospirae bacterium]|nr:response regulator [Nitrospirota bacterium]